MKQSEYVRVLSVAILASLSASYIKTGDLMSLPELEIVFLTWLLDNKIEFRDSTP